MANRVLNTLDELPSLAVEMAREPKWPLLVSWRYCKDRSTKQNALMWN